MEYKIVKKKVKNYRITLKPDGIVYVTAPFYASSDDIDSFIKKNEEWINKNYSKAVDDTLIDNLYENSTIYILGKPYIVRTIYSKIKDIKLENGYITFYLLEDSIKEKEKLYGKFIKELTVSTYNEILNKYLKLTGLSINKLSIKKMTRSFGRCYYTKKEIVLSSTLIHKTLEFIDAIIIHEVAHLKYPNHSKDFYNYIDIYNKNYKVDVKRYKEQRRTMNLFKKKDFNKDNVVEEVNLVEETKTNEPKNKKELSKLSLKYQFKTKKNRVRFITRVSMFSALSYVFYVFFKFPLPFLPSFLEINFSFIFIIIGSLLTGPVGGLIISLIRFLLKLPLTTTAYAGELIDLLLAIVVMLPASITYLYKHDKKGGFIGIVLSFISWIVFSLIFNYLMALPLYIKVYFNGDTSSLVNVLKATMKNVNEDNYMAYYLFLGVLPFNIINGLINCGLALLVYKKISTVLKRMGL